MSLTLLLGDLHQGKTAMCRRLVEHARDKDLTVGGILAPAVFKHQDRVGYDIHNLATRRSTRLAVVEEDGVEQTGRYHFLADGLALGRFALERAAQESPQLIIVDEVGPLELAGQGWARHLSPLLQQPSFNLWTVRRSIADDVVKQWGDESTDRYDLSNGPDTVINAVINRLTGKSP
jgi:iron complex transport system ATP-binding protein